MAFWTREYPYTLFSSPVYPSSNWAFVTAFPHYFKRRVRRDWIRVDSGFESRMGSRAGSREELVVHGDDRKNGEITYEDRARQPLMNDGAARVNPNGTV